MSTTSTTTTQTQTASPAPAARAAGARGFTLVELMVSIALVLLLILGVNQVFKLTSDTIGASNGLSDAIRMNRAAQASMFDDLRKAILPGDGLARGGPFLIIESSRIAAFPDANAEAADRDYVRDTATTNLAQVDEQIRTRDTDGDNTESLAEASPIVTMDDRSHRSDMIGFFARDIYRRQTGNDGSFAADQTASEAMVWYGHLKQPGERLTLAQARNLSYTRQTVSSGNTQTLTRDNNPYNFYARQWILGRVAMLLIEPEPDGPDWVIPRYDGYGVRRENQTYIGRSRSSSASATRLSPLNLGSDPTTNGNSFTDQDSEIDWARYDLAGTSITGFENILKFAYGNGRTNWWDSQFSGLMFRFSGFPYPTKPMTSYGAARTHPCFVPACTQFAVEFAGDYIAQFRGDLNGDGVEDARDRADARYGQAQAPVSDGVIDFIVDRSGTDPVERIRWYGYPRNVDTTDDTATAAVIRSSPRSGDINTMRDVVPVRDLLAACPAISPAPVPPTQIPAPFERALPAVPAGGDYGVTGAVAHNARYVVAWGPPGTYHTTDVPPVPLPMPKLPKMLRMVVGVDDTESRMTATQFYEYVVELP